MLTDFTRIVTIKPNDLARELAESDDLLAIASFINVLSKHMGARANMGMTRSASKSEKDIRKAINNFTFGIDTAVIKFKKDLDI